MHRGIVMLVYNLGLLTPIKRNCNATASKVILDNDMLPTL